ncbi:TetR/AcrR family transcriptional regulator [Streptomyces exfoliatus]|uniref:TetR/AcrR family transcriptional regulator n=1 Tax=Streptomyces exfoliatus TaxID=1905 RepID=UPI00068B3875|nr:TetR/AcrR family transcriptional regulator [Streptomyces exfoliatus]
MRHGETPAPERPTQPLTRPHIVAAGLRLLEREGAAGLSMRKLAGELGKAPAAVYRHVSDKRELMSLLFDEVSRRIVLPEVGDDPRAAVLEAAQSAHRVMEEHGWIATGMLDGALLGATSMRLSEFILDALVRDGMSDAQAARLDVAIWQYLVGHLVAVRAAPYPPVPGGDEDYPTVRRVAPLVASMSDHERFTAGLVVLLDGAFAEPRAARDDTAGHGGTAGHDDVATREAPSVSPSLSPSGADAVE